MVKRTLYFIGAAIAFAVGIWLAATLFVGLAIIGLIAYGLYYSRDYLISKGILNPRPGMPLDEVREERITIIEGDFERIEDKEPR